MAQQPPFGSGTTPQRSDTRLFLLSKQLQALQAKAGALSANDAKRNDTVRRLRGKLARAKLATALNANA